MEIVYSSESTEAEALLRQDPTLKPLFEKTKIVRFRADGNHFLALVEAIIAQQLSGKAASSILAKVNVFFHDDITKEKIMASSDDELKALGLSRQKISYLRSLAGLTLAGALDFNQIENLSDQEITDALIKVKGIGKWTVEMFLLFSLGRRDVFSAGDLGIRNALKRLYQKEFTPKEAEALAERWKPYRSLVTHFLWHYLEA